LANHSVCDAALALWYTAPGQAEIRSEPLAALSADEVRVRATFGALSRGTESLVFGGRVPVAEYGRMGAPFMSGAFPFPVKYGYSTVGVVESGQDDLVGRNVFTLHPHQTCFNHPKAAVFPLPDEVPSSRAVLAANMETALNAVWNAMPGPADRVAVVGGGVVGMLVAYLCGQLPGAEVTLVDIDPTREQVARALGVAFSVPASAPGGADVVIHASGTAAGLETAIGLAGDEATVLELSWFGSGSIPVSLGGAFHSQELRLVCSQVGHVARSHRPRWSHARRLAAAIRLLRDPRLDALLSPAIDFNALPARLPDILGQPGGTLCQLIAYP
jgi:NADPH:quinone reductase-like Zn-dependent oxidoreductase